MLPVEVDEFAKEHGYETADYLCEWRGFSCYEPVYTKDELAYIGMPAMILVDKDGKIRMATYDEVMQRMDELD
ncbi:hypothetical protein [Butyrivibrio sp.]|uniref:hypothetical protein n=1 Tax=Butyrivibrio sp. TaxID=28121 RepID=UPI0025B9C433|nr:hypothetical protein [Butyrivibrio sp.]MBE5838440.1 hypothetical protein [Butyrivibrio sp.]